MNIERFTIKNACGANCDIINLGAAISALRLPDRDGNIHDIVLGYDDPQAYLDNPYYFGVVVGRFANRIAHGRFSLNNKDYALAQNEYPNHIHGGQQGFHKQLWSKTSTENANTITLHYVSKDGEEQYPGNLDVTVSYCLSDDNELIIEYTARTDKPTIINLTQHSYFNLAGHNSGDILDHHIQINADQFTPLGEAQIPTGDISSVQGTPLDLRQAKRIGDIVNTAHPQLTPVCGFDHNYVLKEKYNKNMHLAAEVHEPNTGRIMRVITDQPGMQFYSGNYIGENTRGKDGASYQQHQGLCLETQHFPDSPNNTDFPSVTLLPEQIFKSKTIYQFAIDE